ncbi:membrane-associated tyrosine- and threonine-specific cdc2-inhibitory kinase [Sardina pilchardus]|uniref:membrane-associated tyrosine- and threonine-specific cdc2-inhibitory kinase n=1 Tax=Sardina pilchardus TaxID=27697 RepID=UPI002E10EE94
MSVTMETNVITTPLPIPVHFSHAQQSFSLKRRRFPFSASSSSALASPSRLSSSLPPRPPSKAACPSVSRLFPQEPPSAWTPLSRSLIAKPPPPSIYDPKRHQSFFSQFFTNLGLLGRGSFGEVYKVLSLLDGCQYAVKRSVQRFRNGSDRARCLREARNHERLGRHPHVLGFVAAWEEGGRLYIQTELCCTSLLLHVEDLPSSPDEVAVWGYLCDLLSALRHLHTDGFTHMDLKPANVFVTRSGRLKLGDFGLLLEKRGAGGVGGGGGGGGGRGKGGARDEELSETEKEDMQEGDPRYMAPELLRGEYGPAADIFSLGVSILELACNMEVPKGGEGWQQLRQGILPSEFTNGLSPELRRVLCLMLAPEPCRRPSAEQLLALPSVRKHSWRRHICLLLHESLQTLLSYSQSVVSVGWGLLSSLNLPFLPRCDPPAPCTPPRGDSWEKEGDLSALPPSPPTPPSELRHSGAESVFLGEESVVLPKLPRFDDSPADRLPSRLSFGSTSTSTPLSAPSSARPNASPPHATHTQTESRDWLTTLENLPYPAYTPPSSHSGVASVVSRLDGTSTGTGTGTAATGTPGFSPIRLHSLNRSRQPSSRTLDRNSPPHTPCSTRSLSRSRSLLRCGEAAWGEGEESVNKRSFEPKNLLTMFDDAV